MDNLTHSLAGAILGQMGLKKKTGLAMPTLIIAANIPDIDAAAVLLGGHQHLAIRRGITHGPIAMVLLPLLLWGAMLAWDKWRPSEKRLPVHKGWLLALAFIGCLSHPILDWLNNYGVRLLEPFSSQWFYGDTIFIIDIWIWAALLISVVWSFRREWRGVDNWQRPAWLGFTAICAYIFANGLITGRAESFFMREVEQQTGAKPTLVVANAVPVQFWKREMQWRNETVHGGGWYGLFEKPYIRGKLLPLAMDNRNIEKARRSDPQVSAYLFWSRMPYAEAQGDRLFVYDQRFGNPLTRGRFDVEIKAAP